MTVTTGRAGQQQARVGHDIPQARQQVIELAEIRGVAVRSASEDNTGTCRSDIECECLPSCDRECERTRWSRSPQSAEMSSRCSATVSPPKMSLTAALLQIVRPASLPQRSNSCDGDWTVITIGMPRPPPSDVQRSNGTGQMSAASSSAIISGGSRRPFGPYEARTFAVSKMCPHNAVNNGARLPWARSAAMR